MKEKIVEIQNYFKSKILAGEFNVKKINLYTISILVDEEYLFTIMYGKFNPHLYISEYNFIMFGFTKEEADKLDSIITPIIMEYKRDKLLGEKRAELAELEAELGLKDTDND